MRPRATRANGLRSGVMIGGPSWSGWPRKAPDSVARTFYGSAASPIARYGRVNENVHDEHMLTAGDVRTTQFPTNQSCRQVADAAPPPGGSVRKTGPIGALKRWRYMASPARVTHPLGCRLPYRVTVPSNPLTHAEPFLDARPRC